MDYVKQYKKITPYHEGPFSDAQLEKDWNDEINTLYEDEEKQYDDRISHRDVLYITHNNLKNHNEQKISNFQRKQSYKQKQAQIDAMKAEEAKLLKNGEKLP